MDLYRNRRNFGIFSQLHTFGNFKSASWNFSESGHGKGAADGIGGSLKRKADKLLAHGEDITNVALQRADSSTQLYVDLQYDTSAVKTIRGTMLVHQVTWTKEKRVWCHYHQQQCHYRQHGHLLFYSYVSQTEVSFVLIISLPCMATYRIIMF